ncbi:hypothetical protein MBH78_09615 [Oceanimonas sp. NS1]|nr:hypothetical protein [Oceanimonas sp. NS1]
MINADDVLGRRWLGRYSDAVAYSLHGRLADFPGVSWWRKRYILWRRGESDH